MIALVASAFAAQVALSLDTSEVREGQTLGLTLTIVDTTARDDAPRITAPQGLEIRYQGQGRERTIINFQPSMTTTYRYALTALARGEYVIGPVTVVTAAGPLTSQPVTLKVGARTTGGTDTLVADIGSRVAYVGQVLVYHLRFQTDKALVTAQWGPPQPDGFTPDPSVQPLVSEYQIVEDGRPLSVEELHYPLRASAPGRWRIPGGVLRAQFPDTRSRRGRDPGFRTMFTDVRSEVFSGDPLDVEVRPLPAEGRPKDATSLVGHFTVTTHASATDVKVGDTVTLQIDVAGDGPLAGYALPPFTGDGFRVYDDQPTVSARLADGRFAATASFKRAVVPQAAGDIEIPGIELSYFDPTAGRWAEATTRPISLHVSGEAGTAQVASFATEAPHTVDALAEDILPIRTDIALSRSISAGWAWLLVMPGALALAAEAAARIVRRPRAVSLRRLSFEDLPADPEGRLAGLERILRERAAGALDVAPDALRREDLAGLGAAAADADAVWRELEGLRYRGWPSDERASAMTILSGSEARVRAVVERLP